MSQNESANDSNTKKILITKDNIRVDSDLINNVDHIEGYILAEFDVEEYFGFELEEGEYIDIYVNYEPENGDIVGKFQVSRLEPEQFGESIYFDLEISEKDAIIQLMRDVGLDEILNEMRANGCDVIDDAEMLEIQY